MPVAVALAASAFTVSAGMATAGVLGGMMVAGGVLSGLGAVTGNAKLSKIGSVLGLVGGVGSMVSSMANGASSAAGAGVGAGADPAAQAAAEAAKQSAATTAADTAAGVAGDAAKQAATTSSGFGGAGMDPGVGGPAAGATSGPWAAATGSEPLAADAAMGVTSPVTDGLIAGAQPTTVSGFGGVGTDAAAQGFGGTTTVAGSGLADNALVKTAGEWFNKGKEGLDALSKWSNANPNNARIVGGLIQGAAKSYGDEQILKDKYELEKKYADWARQRYSDSVRNLTIPTLALAPRGVINNQRG